MGLSSSKSKTKSTSTTLPSPFSSPYVRGAADTLGPAYQAAVTNNATLLPRVNSALDYTRSVMNGDFLNGNPYLQKVIDATNRDITTGVGSQFEGAGRYGSGDFAQVLARALADNENKLRYADYSQERAYQNAAPGQLMGEVGVSAALPQAASDTYAGSVQRLLGQYTTTNGTQTTTSSPSIGGMILGALANAASAAAMGSMGGSGIGLGGMQNFSGWPNFSGVNFSDRRLKTNIQLVRRDPDGLGWYNWNWKRDPDGPVQFGVIADEVEKLRPWAFVPDFRDGYAGVNYGAL